MDANLYNSEVEAHGHKLYREFAPYRVNVPEGTAGPWAIKKFVTGYGLGYLRLARDRREPGIGEFTKLEHQRRGVVMSDTCAEIEDLRPYIMKLQGDVLVAGLGLGMVLHILTKAPEIPRSHVKSITVLEIDKDVISLVGDHYRKSDHRIKIINADVTTWKPPAGAKFDSAWYDIWDDICEDNREQMDMIRERYRKFVRFNRQYFWGKATMDRLAREDKRRYGW